MDALNASIREDLSCIKEDLSSLNETMNRINSHMEEQDNHVTTEPTMTSECLQPNVTQPPNNDRLHTCGGTGGWRRVVYLDMTDPNTTCPSGWQLTSHSRRTCGRVSTGMLTSDSVTFPVSGGDYTRVCGRIKGYHYRATDAFEAYHKGRVTTIDDAYVSGVSLTHGSPRQHIWTFAAGRSEVQPTWVDVCPSTLVMLPLILPSHHLWVETIFVNQDGTQDLIYYSFQMILSGMVMAVLPAVHVAHSTILHISLNNSPALPLMM